MNVRVPVVAKPPAAVQPLLKGEVVQPSSTQAQSDLDEVLTARRTRIKPSNVDDYAWSLAEEMRRNGGLFDLSVQIARLEAEYRNLEALVESNDILPSTAFAHRMKLTTQIAELKSKAVDVASKTRTIITLDGLQTVMTALLNSLQTHISDPHLLERIGRDVTDAVRAALTSVRAK